MNGRVLEGGARVLHSEYKASLGDRVKLVVGLCVLGLATPQLLRDSSLSVTWPLRDCSGREGGGEVRQAMTGDNDQVGSQRSEFD